MPHRCAMEFTPDCEDILKRLNEANTTLAFKDRFCQGEWKRRRYLQTSE